ncbi:P-II family nitrogen regulator [Clostridium thermosuccinogenes]|mgnify:CR=1 FL=1|jgi:nitrogen regulatory protein PII 2|uniref:P-II family nitrogen regulator n=1 Tax=Clostridium thermosuccinogenes TaxID=84032 RepID=A0A2K2F8R3_9CLOT|nr:P-II family nitrogen regulator [Pseudoclostridium thermosuccinogenes]AUS95880.1 P-II family nitrogen regulator [Pseudoclostridium thermosuccinogenes]PNT93403.1 P-II family nitrogen regulator [Pseudoclostridium thermosuccinogenes]PNT95171.1 P-II family nitrogen regulator [Pseudoclostridium thermosuccinogenes]PNT96025.1 P-II family nitrogen regulator [Pseudoclostridium thermosuccinogenes]
MKEIVSIIRINKIGDTKQALAEAGYPAFVCKKVNGRGKKMLKPEIFQKLVAEEEISPPELMESIAGNDRLLAKRMLSLVVADEDVKKVVDIIIETNQTGSMGDGKIFVCPVDEVIRVRTGETGIDAI